MSVQSHSLQALCPQPGLYASRLSHGFSVPSPGRPWRGCGEQDTHQACLCDTSFDPAAPPGWLPNVEASTFSFSISSFDVSCLGSQTHGQDCLSVCLSVCLSLHCSLESVWSTPVTTFHLISTVTEQSWTHPHFTDGESEAEGW